MDVSKPEPNGASRGGVGRGKSDLRVEGCRLLHIEYGGYIGDMLVMYWEDGKENGSII